MSNTTLKFEGKAWSTFLEVELAPATKIETVYPSFFPRTACGKNGCKEEHHNDNFKQKVKKKCNGLDGDCGQFLPAGAAKCPWCNSKDLDGEDIPEDMRFEDIDEEILKVLPEPGEHHHEH